MSLRPDHKALVFVGAVAVLGAGVRVVRAASGSTATPGAQPALDRQMASADSAAFSASNRADRGASRGRARASDSRRRLAGSDSDDTATAFDPEQGAPSRKRSGP